MQRGGWQLPPAVGMSETPDPLHTVAILASAQVPLLTCVI
ncbi:hypothetical protein CYB_1241 [Synechococcus sp. JA-2-3B'a(2-13)]|nr:hypothetical protein CYB_1241 [Synechococcus sp. JA-2-3B'a(2-13)]